MTWTGANWTEDQTLSVYDRIRAHARESTDGDREWMRATSIAAIERLARADRRYAATADQWDLHHWLLNTPGGIVDLISGELHDCDPEAYFTKVAAATPGGDASTWLRFLNQVTGNDAEYVAFLQRVAGYAATGSTREHALFFLYGPGGKRF